MTEQEQVQVSQADRGAANALATEICGCATPEQRKRDVAAILAYRHTATAEALEAMREALNTTIRPSGNRRGVYDILRTAIAKIEGEQP